MAGLAMLFDTDAWATPSSVSVVLDGTSLDAVNRDGVISYEPGDRLEFTPDASAITVTFNYTRAVTADCIAIIGVNFFGDVSVTTSGGPVTLDQSPALPSDDWGRLHYNNKWLTFPVTSSAVWNVRISGITKFPSLSTLHPRWISRIVGGIHYVPPRSYRINPSIDVRRAGERSHQGSYRDAGEYPLFRRIRLRFHRAQSDQVRRFHEMMSRRAVRDPLVLCLDTEPAEADYSTAYVQVGNRLRIQPYLRQGNMDIEFDEVIN